MNIGLDMMGGDFAPLEAVKVLKLFLEANKGDVTLYLFGDEAIVSPLLEEHGIPGGSYKLIHAPQVIGMHEHPTKALKEKQQSSIAMGFYSLATAKIDAFISAGNTIIVFSLTLATSSCCFWLFHHRTLTAGIIIFPETVGIKTMRCFNFPTCVPFTASVSRLGCCG